MDSNIVEKYNEVLLLFDQKKVKVSELAQILESCVKVIKQKYNNYDQQHKIAGTFVIVKLYQESESFNITQIEEILQGFYQYFDDEYKKYIDSLSLISERFDTDLSFYYNFIKNKKGS